MPPQGPFGTVGQLGRGRGRTPGHPATASGARASHLPHSLRFPRLISSRNDNNAGIFAMGIPAAISVGYFVWLVTNFS